MGVPALFRWLAKKYPKIVQPVVVESLDGIDPEALLEGANPNGIEFDNLYLDMNGIIHPCCNPQNGSAPATEAEKMIAIFEYIDYILAMIRPRKLLYLAIDGVAPRAKMNQQRSRRFRAAKERMAALSDAPSSDDAKESHKAAFDSNCITPGTQFMDLVAQSLRFYVAERLGRVSAWRDLKVIVSDASVPGEGEHKIVDYIRRQRLDPSHDPNTQHVIYGLDADLIMLSMATHEPNFYVLREDVFAEERKKWSKCTDCGQKGHPTEECPQSNPNLLLEKEKPFVFLKVSVLREYLNAELFPENLSPQIKLSWDLERAIDDWIFLCFFVGNDFLPHMPSLEIREGAIDSLVDIYKKHRISPDQSSHRYITNCGVVDLNLVELVLSELGVLESKIFEKRHEREISFQKTNTSTSSFATTATGPLPPSNQSCTSIIAQSAKDNRAAARAILLQKGTDFLKKESSGICILDINEIESSASVSSEVLIAQETNETESTVSEVVLPLEEPAISDSTSSLNKTEKENVEDTVRLWEPGYRSRYYLQKFGFNLDPSDVKQCQEAQEGVQKVANAYIEGLCWVLAYYYTGCASWNWYYPYHFAPFAADMTQIAQNFNISFTLGCPFRPFEQLMAVLPADSAALVPAPFRSLMTDPHSPIADFYPADFEIDLNGKRNAWNGVVLLPFIDEHRLLSTIQTVYDLISPEEVQRNTRGSEYLYIGLSNTASKSLLASLNDDTHAANIDADLIGGLAGSIMRASIFPSPGVEMPCPFVTTDLESSEDGREKIVNITPIVCLKIVVFRYLLPFSERSNLKHRVTPLLPGVSFGPAVLTAEDVQRIKNPPRHGRSLFAASRPSHRERVNHHSMHREFTSTRLEGVYNESTSSLPVKRQIENEYFDRSQHDHGRRGNHRNSQNNYQNTHQVQRHEYQNYERHNQHPQYSHGVSKNYNSQYQRPRQSDVGTYGHYQSHEVVGSNYSNRPSQDANHHTRAQYEMQNTQYHGLNGYAYPAPTMDLSHMTNYPAPAIPPSQSSTTQWQLYSGRPPK